MTSRVYFLQSQASKLVKIGWTADLKSRLENLRASSPDALVLLTTCAGGPSLEGHLHEQFAEDRVRGEWFTSSEPLMDFVAKVKTYGDAFVAAGFANTDCPLPAFRRQEASRVREMARGYAMVVLERLCQREPSKMSAYTILARQIGVSPIWVRRLVGRQMGLTLHAHVYLSLFDLASRSEELVHLRTREPSGFEICPMRPG